MLAYLQVVLIGTYLSFFFVNSELDCSCSWFRTKIVHSSFQSQLPAHEMHWCQCSIFWGSFRWLCNQLLDRYNQYNQYFVLYEKAVCKAIPIWTLSDCDWSMNGPRSAAIFKTFFCLISHTVLYSSFISAGISRFWIDPLSLMILSFISADQRPNSVKSRSKWGLTTVSWLKSC